ncbi:SGNH/GDSL hydrolase family protein [Xenophilus azovorans]|uniref:SGNH/GDSL hydrolase family protein n=1 Tax=Xenophilus azovorans TaxID=151755 RepID=UPI00056DB8D8|nr:SGNH/GDSL hydrolase family protein [Xenophilus azovorans]
MPSRTELQGRRRLGAACAAASLLALAGMAGAAARPDCSVALYGDSILHGGYGGMKRLPDPPATMLRRMRPMYRVDEHTIPGDSAHAHLAQFIHTPLTSRIVVLQYGINDAGQGHDYRTALETMVAYVRSQGRTPVVTGLSRVTGGIPRRDAYDAVARQVAAADGAAFADWGAVRFAPADMADPVHPGPSYARRLTQQLVRALDAVAPECAGRGGPAGANAWLAVLFTPWLRPRRGRTAPSGTPQSSAAAASHAFRAASSELWPLVELAARERLCEVHGAAPGCALRVRGTESELHALLSHLAAVVRQGLGTQARPHVAATVQAAQAVLHWAAPDGTGEDDEAPRLAQLFSRLASTTAAPTAAERALHQSVHAALRIVHRCGGRLYAAPSPLARMGLTLRLPLAEGEHPPLQEPKA